MAFSRALGVISIISVSCLAAVGCGDDDSNSQPPGGAGESGEAGETSGGTSAGGTSNGGTGNGGTSSAGDAGNGTGGTAGDAGAGVGGQPVVGGAGGEPAVGGAAGAAGAGGEPPVVASAPQCGNSCEQDEDCFIDELNPSACDPETKRCYPTDKVLCVNNTSCIPNASFWFVECESDGDCADDDTERCVGVDGKGYCALLPGPDGCDEFSAATELPVFGSTAGAKATVCAAVWDRCRDGNCYYGCGDPFFEGDACGVGDGDTCNEVTGLCECATGAECDPSGVCQANKLCAECATDQNCIDKDAIGLDKCVAGKCGCAAASSCPDLTESATPVCE